MTSRCDRPAGGLTAQDKRLDLSNMAKRAGHRLTVFLHSCFTPYAKQLRSDKATFEYKLEPVLPECLILSLCINVTMAASLESLTLLRVVKWF